MTLGIALAERGLLTDGLIRFGIRRMLRERLRAEATRAPGSFLAEMARGPVAPVPSLPNRQHYEVTAEFYRSVLGRHLKYSSAYWPEGVVNLDEAEAAMLERTANFAGLRDGHRILELGCGWGSLSLWMARRFPRSEIVGVSNSNSQRQTIEGEARALGLANLTILTADMNRFEAPGTFDRIVSVEMFEHMRNWSALLSRVAGWLRDDGRLFLHVFAHRSFVYPFEDRGADDWMGKNFFTGGMMPSVDLLRRLTIPFDVEAEEVISGTHYAKTAEAWLQNLDRTSAHVLSHFREGMSAKDARLAIRRWRIFFLACAELFAFEGGSEWLVTHHRLVPRRGAGGSS